MAHHLLDFVDLERADRLRSERVAQVVEDAVREVDVAMVDELAGADAQLVLLAEWPPRSRARLTVQRQPLSRPGPAWWLGTAGGRDGLSEE